MDSKLTPRPATDAERDIVGRAAERSAILSYGAALAREEAAFRAIEVWRRIRGDCEERQAWMHPVDSEALQKRLDAAERTAVDVHAAAKRELNALSSPFTVVANRVAQRPH